MKALALFATLALAKLMMVAGRELPLSAWTPLALFGQDALVALLFGLADGAIQKGSVPSFCTFRKGVKKGSVPSFDNFRMPDRAVRQKTALVWGLFWVLVAYTAVNVPLTRILSSPLTWRMSRAAGGPLWDSIRYYLTPGNLGWIALVLLAGAVFAAATRKLPPTWARIGLRSLAGLALAGAWSRPPNLTM